MNQVQSIASHKCRLERLRQAAVCVCRRQYQSLRTRLSGYARVSRRLRTRRNVNWILYQWTVSERLAMLKRGIAIDAVRSLTALQVLWWSQLLERSSLNPPPCLALRICRALRLHRLHCAGRPGGDSAASSCRVALEKGRAVCGGASSRSSAVLTMPAKCAHRAASRCCICPIVSAPAVCLWGRWAGNWQCLVSCHK